MIELQHFYAVSLSAFGLAVLAVVVRRPQMFAPRFARSHRLTGLALLTWLFVGAAQLICPSASIAPLWYLIPISKLWRYTDRSHMVQVRPCTGRTGHTSDCDCRIRLPSPRRRQEPRLRYAHTFGSVCLPRIPTGTHLTAYICLVFVAGHIYIFGCFCFD